MTEDKQDEGKVKLFTEIKHNTRDLIDELKVKEDTTIGHIIEKSVQTYIDFKSMSPEVQTLIEKYTKIYGNMSDVIEDAMRIFDGQKNPMNSKDLELWCRAREELQTMLIGKTTFHQLLAAAEKPEKSLEQPAKKNIGLDVILWVTGKSIKSLSLKEIIDAIKKMWVVANYFYHIEVNEESTDQFYIVFKHNEGKRFSNYWLQYFTELFHSEDLSFRCATEGEALGETLSLTVKLLNKKIETQKE